MSNEPIDDADLRKFIQKERRRLQQVSEAERQALIEQRVREAFTQELAEEREESEREAEIYSVELARDPTREKERARETAKQAALLLIMLLLILLLIAAATGRSDILQIPGAQPTQTLRPYLSGSGGAQYRSDNIPATSVLQPPPEISPLFRDYYYSHNGPDIFGRPVGPETQENGRSVQWFQRARLEYWPELSDKGYSVLGTLIGVRYIDQEKINFPTQQPFINQEKVRYFPETGHGLASPFLDFWVTYEGMRVLGYPISDQLQETLSDNQIHTVQYFERGRLEFHPENTDLGQQVQLGLLGNGLYANPNHSRIIAAPTPVPLPTPIAPTPVPPSAVR
jgi:hypothetical protein